MTPSISDALAQLRQQFITQLPGRLDQINQHFDRLNPADWQCSAADELHRLVHGLTGSAGTFGMQSVSDAARALELRLATLLETGAAPGVAKWQDIDEARRHLDSLSRLLVKSGAPSLKPPSSTPRLDRSPLIHLVEDDPDQAEHLSQALQNEGYRVRVFTEPAEFRTAYVATGDDHPAAVVMDMMFPESDTEGAILIAELGLGSDSGVPVVVVSVRDDMEARLAALRAGACRYLVKPIQIAQLADQLDNLTGRQPPQPYRVLMVDDEPLLLEAQAGILRSAGMEVLTLSKPLQLIEYLNNFTPDVVVLDVYMPEASGPELAAVLRERDAQLHLPILFLSAETDMTRQLLALNLGGDDFLVKPVQSDHLVAAVTARARRTRQNLAIRQRLETTLYEREREHLALDQHAIVSITDQNGNITYVNEKFCEISGYTRAELLGKNHRLLKSGTHKDDYYRELWDTLCKGQVWQGEICNRRRDGSQYWTKSTLTPFLDGTGKPYQYVSVNTDITHVKETEQALIAARQEAERANLAKSEFLSNMSHELRSPMNAILGFGQLLECDDSLSTENIDSVQEILHAGKHLLELINEVLDLSKVESGHLLLSLEAVEISPIVDECLSLLGTQARQRGITLSHSRIDHAAVRADRTRLRQVLLNLLSNAVKYNREGGSVHLDIIPASDERLCIRVKDTGPGIPAERMNELFQPFNRLGAETSDIEGTGIGLTITRRLVEMMDGIVEAKSETGIGSTFWIELPLASAPLRREKLPDIRSAGLQRPPVVAPRKVLYIEDNPSNLKLVSHLLERRGNYRLLTADRPVQGLELALTEHPELILLDINMPGMDGYQLLKIFKAETRMAGIPIIAITANAMSRDIARGLAAGFTEYLTKPLDVTDFFNMLDRCLPEQHRGGI